MRGSGAAGSIALIGLTSHWLQWRHVYCRSVGEKELDYRSSLTAIEALSHMCTCAAFVGDSQALLVTKPEPGAPLRQSWVSTRHANTLLD